jgi:hypothetical protein
MVQQFHLAAVQQWQEIAADLVAEITALLTTNEPDRVRCHCGT